QMRRRLLLALPLRPTAVPTLSLHDALPISQIEGETVPLFAGVWAIFGHGNVAGMGEALHAVRGQLPTYRAHNEQGMAHAAIAFADRKSTRLNSSHVKISYAVLCLKKKSGHV